MTTIGNTASHSLYVYLGPCFTFQSILILLEICVRYFETVTDKKGLNNQLVLSATVRALIYSPDILFMFSICLFPICI